MRRLFTYKVVFLDGGIAALLCDACRRGPTSFSIFEYQNIYLNNKNIICEAM